MDPALLSALIYILGPVIVAVGGALGYLYKAVQTANDKAIASAEASVLKAEAKLEKVEKERETYRELLKDAVKVLPVAVNLGLEKQGLPPLPLVADVVPISHSDVTPEQEREAEIYTALAAVALAKTVLGLPPRVADPPAKSVHTEVTVVEVPNGKEVVPPATDKKEGA